MGRTVRLRVMEKEIHKYCYERYGNGTIFILVACRVNISGVSLGWIAVSSYSVHITQSI